MPVDVLTQNITVHSWGGTKNTRPEPQHPVLPADQRLIQLVNNTAAATKGYKRFGLIFKKGHVPKKTCVAIERSGSAVRAQFSDRSYWDDGSLKRATVFLMDSDFAASESRDYEWKLKTGSFNDTGSVTAANIAAISDIKIEITGLQRNASTVSGVGSAKTQTDSFSADPLGSSFSLSLNSLVGSSSNFEIRKGLGENRIISGPVCDAFTVIGRVKSSTNVAHPHLKVYFDVYAWKDAQGNIVDLEYCAFLAMEEWAVTDKYRLDYNAKLLDGTTEKAAFTNVYHHYHSQWGMFNLSSEDTLYCGHHFKNNAPTLYVKYNARYMRETGLIPWYDLDTALSDPRDYNAPYVPLHYINGRTGVDGTGAYIWRSPISGPAANALILQTAKAYRQSRTSATEGLHVPYHYRAPDFNILPFKMINPTDPDIPNDFTSDGLPASGYWGTHNDTDTDKTGGYVKPVGVSKAWPVGDSINEWKPSIDASHAAPYCYSDYLLFGDLWMLRAHVSHTTNLYHQAIASDRAVWGTITKPIYKWLTTSSSPDEVWHGVPAPNEQQTRGLGLAMQMMAYAYNVTPVNAVWSNYMKAAFSHFMNYLGRSEQFFKEDHRKSGIFYEFYMNRRNLGSSPFMISLLNQGIVACGLASDNAVARKLMEWPLQYYRDAWVGSPYAFGEYYYCTGSRSGKFYENDKTFLPANDFYHNDTIITWDSSKNHFTAASLWSSYIPVADGDKLRFWEFDNNASNLGLPQGVQSNVVYYVRDWNSTNKSFNVCATPGGPAIIPSSANRHRIFMQNAAVKTNFSLIPNYSQHGSFLMNLCVCHLIKVWTDREGVKFSEFKKGHSMIGSYRPNQFADWRIDPNRAGV